MGSVDINTALSTKSGLFAVGGSVMRHRMVTVADKTKNINMLRSHHETQMAYHLIPTSFKYSFCI